MDWLTEFQNWLSALNSLEYWLFATVVLLVIMAAYLVRLVWGFAKQVRCMQFCYRELSDMYINDMENEIRYRTGGTGENSESEIAAAQRKWKNIVLSHFQEMRQAGILMKYFDKSERYALEDL